MDGLSEAQKEILIFLLLAALILVITCIISYCVWRKWCKKELKRARQSRNQQSESDEGDLEGQAFRFHAQAMASASYNTSLWNEPNQTNNEAFPVASVAPSAPSLASFRTLSNSDTATTQATRFPSVSEDISLHSNQRNLLPSAAEGSDGLPTYEELMIRRDSRINR